MTQPPPSYPHPGYPPAGNMPPPSGYAVPHQYAPPVWQRKPAGPGGAPLAEFGERLLAYLLDSLVLTAITIVPGLALMALILVPYLNALESAAKHGPVTLGPILLVFFGTFLGSLAIQVTATYLYQVSYQMRRGQTVGKRVMKLKIVNAETGAPMDVPAARKRWAIHLALAFLGPGGYLDGLWQLWDPQKQTLHDKVARTVVVKVPT